MQAVSTIAFVVMLTRTRRDDEKSLVSASNIKKTRWPVATTHNRNLEFLRPVDHRHSDSVVRVTPEAFFALHKKRQRGTNVWLHRVDPKIS